MKGHPLEEYVQRADELAHEVVRAWVVDVKAGNSEYLTPEFKGVFDKAFEYRQAESLPTIVASSASLPIKRRRGTHIARGVRCGISAMDRGTSTRTP